MKYSFSTHNILQISKLAHLFLNPTSKMQIKFIHIKATANIKEIVHCLLRSRPCLMIAPPTARTSKPASSSHCTDQTTLPEHFYSSKQTLYSTHTAEMSQFPPTTGTYEGTTHDCHQKS